MDRITKFSRKLHSALRRKLADTLDLINLGQLNGLDVRPLQGHKGYFRCRIGDIRIIFVSQPGGKNIPIDVGFRGDIYKRWK